MFDIRSCRNEKWGWQTVEIQPCIYDISKSTTTVKKFKKKCKNAFVNIQNTSLDFMLVSHALYFLQLERRRKCATYILSKEVWNNFLSNILKNLGKLVWSYPEESCPFPFWEIRKFKNCMLSIIIQNTLANYFETFRKASL